MSEAALDPYVVLGVSPDVSDIELRRVYRGLVKRHHPDHNGGSPDSARRFAQIQSAYAMIAQRRRGPGAAAHDQGAGASGPGASDQPDPDEFPQASVADDSLEQRIASIEREMAARRAAEQRRAQEQARLAQEQAARFTAAQRSTQARRVGATPEELGYYSTDDSFTKIIDDAAEQLAERLNRSEAKKQFTRRLSDLFGRDG